MTTPAFVRLIFLKDVRAMRVPLVLLLLGLFAVIYLTFYTPSSGYFGTAGAVFGMFFVCVGALLLTVHVVQSDPAGRELRFLFTRPVPGLTVGWAKGLFLLAFVVSPYYGGLEWAAARSGISLGLADHLLLLLETSVQIGALLAALVLLSVFLNNGISVFLTIVGFFVAAVATSIWWHQWIFSLGHLPYAGPDEERLGNLRGWLGELAFLVVALVAVGLRYRKRNFRVPLAVALAGLVLGYLVGAYFPVDLVRHLQGGDAGSPLTKEELARIRMVLVPHPLHQPPYNWNGGGTSNGIRYDALQHVVRMEGVQAPYYVQTIRYHAVATLPSGKTVVSDSATSPVHGFMGGLDLDLVAKSAGLEPTRHDDGEQTLELLTVATHDLPREDLTGATIRGLITLDVRRVYLMGTMPIRTHAAASFARESYQIADADFSENSVTITISSFRMPLLLRGDRSDWQMPEQWLAVYRPYKEILEESGGSSSSGTVFGLHCFQGRQTYKEPFHDQMSNWRPLPSGWASGAELEFYGSTSVGRVSLPYEIENVDLRPPP